MLRIMHTTNLTGVASIDFAELAEAVALQAGECLGACDAYEADSLPTMVRLHAETMRDFASVLDETDCCWSSPDGRRRLVSELSTARWDLVEAFEIVSAKAVHLAPGYLNRVVGALSVMMTALRSIDRALACVDYQFPTSLAGLDAAEMELAA